MIALKSLFYFTLYAIKQLIYEVNNSIKKTVLFFFIYNKMSNKISIKIRNKIICTLIY